MSQPVILKVYGNLFPVEQVLANHLKTICLEAIGENTISLKNGLLQISFEGIYFPVEEAIACIRELLHAEQSGKLDVLDLENWTLFRYQFLHGKIKKGKRPLNDVLAYSGH